MCVCVGGEGLRGMGGKERGVGGGGPWGGVEGEGKEGELRVVVMGG